MFCERNVLLNKSLLSKHGRQYSSKLQMLKAMRTLQNTGFVSLNNSDPARKNFL